MTSKLNKLVRRELRGSLLDYLLLLSGSVIFLLFLQLFQGQRLMSFAVIIIFVFLYVFWGVLHHSSDKSLNAKSVIEYILIGITILLLLIVVFAM